MNPLVREETNKLFKFALSQVKNDPVLFAAVMEGGQVLYVKEVLVNGQPYHAKVAIGKKAILGEETRQVGGGEVVLPQVRPGSDGLRNPSRRRPSRPPRP